VTAFTYKVSLFTTFWILDGGCFPAGTRPAHFGLVGSESASDAQTRLG
jgi:hypothetical protein